MASLPPSTLLQQENFANFVSTAHSWYKHIPFWPPGVTFHFFVDPSAGFERRVTIFGKVKSTPRAKQGFHYSWIPTAEYRERFGYLAFCYGAGPKASDIRLGYSVRSADDSAAIPVNGRLYKLPSEIIEAGSVQLSSVIHGLSAFYSHWDESRSTESLTWPAESGGRETVQRIIERCQAMRHETFEQSQKSRILIEGEGFVDARLFELLRTERERQLTEMIKAMQRVCELVYK